MHFARFILFTFNHELIRNVGIDIKPAPLLAQVHAYAHAPWPAESDRDRRLLKKCNCQIVLRVNRRRGKQVQAHQEKLIRSGDHSRLGQLFRRAPSLRPTKVAENWRGRGERSSREGGEPERERTDGEEEKRGGQGEKMKGGKKGTERGVAPRREERLYSLYQK